MFEDSEKSVEDERTNSLNESIGQNLQTKKLIDQITDNALEKSVLPCRSSRQRQPNTSWWRGNQESISTLLSEPKTFTETIRSAENERWKSATAHEIDP